MSARRTRELSFDRQLRKAIQRASITQREAAALLRVSPKTIETWLTTGKSMRVPHFLMQKGALEILWDFATVKRRAKPAPGPRWRITEGEILHDVVSLRAFSADRQIAYERLHYAYRQKKEYSGLKIERIVR
jgi:hypothetical protein